MKEIKELPQTLTFKGDEFAQVAKSAFTYAYLRLYNGVKYMEVFKIKTAEILSDFDNKIGSGEFKHRYPSDNDFGTWAWCFNVSESQEVAMEKFNSIKD